MSSMRSIVYVSSAVRLMSESELEALLVESRERNRHTQITGVLLYSGGNFIQCIEGADASVRATYERIRASRRHGGIIELLNDAVAARSFPDWQMGFKHAEASELLALSSAQWQRQADEAAAPAMESAGLFLLKQFWRRV